jgi:pantothenate synthetase
MGVDSIDYVNIIDINKIIKPYIKKRKYKIFLAYNINKVRLIDNI